MEQLLVVTVDQDQIFLDVIQALLIVEFMQVADQEELVLQAQV